MEDKDLVGVTELFKLMILMRMKERGRIQMHEVFVCYFHFTFFCKVM